MEWLMDERVCRFALLNDPPKGRGESSSRETSFFACYSGAWRWWGKIRGWEALLSFEGGLTGRYLSLKVNKLLASEQGS